MASPDSPPPPKDVLHYPETQATKGVSEPKTRGMARASVMLLGDVCKRGLLIQETGYNKIFDVTY